MSNFDLLDEIGLVWKINPVDGRWKYEREEMQLIITQHQPPIARIQLIDWAFEVLWYCKHGEYLHFINGPILNQYVNAVGTEDDKAASIYCTCEVWVKTFVTDCAPLSDIDSAIVMSILPGDTLQRILDYFKDDEDEDEDDWDDEDEDEDEMDEDDSSESGDGNIEHNDGQEIGIEDVLTLFRNKIDDKDDGVNVKQQTPLVCTDDWKKRG